MADRSYLTGLIQRGVPFVVSLLVFVLVVQLLGALEWNGTALRVLALIVAAAAAFVAWAITSTAIKARQGRGLHPGDRHADPVDELPRLAKSETPARPKSEPAVD